MTSPPPILWQKVTPTDGYLFAEFEIPGGLLDAGALASISLPPQATRTDLGIIISGRGPVWLYAHLTHLAHIFAWVGVYDPRLAKAVVVQRHRLDSPPLGALVECP